MLSEECSTFRLTEIMGKRAVVSGEKSMSLNVWLSVEETH